MVLVSTHRFSLNKSASKLVAELIEDADKYRVSVETSECGATIIDAGLKGKGGFRAGEIVTEICLAGCGRASIVPIQYGEWVLPSIFVTTDYPVLSTLGFQHAGWQIRAEDFSAKAYGPGRALAMEPNDLFKKFQFMEESNSAVIVLESEKKPPEAVVQQIAVKCGVSAENLFLIIIASTSLTGVIQACGRVVETGLHTLVQNGLEPLIVKHAWGYAPIASISQNAIEVSERTEGAILSAGVANYTVDSDDERFLRTVLSQSHASALKMFLEAKRLADQNPRYKDLLKETGMDQMKVGANAIAPAMVTICSAKTGMSFTAGKFDFETLKRSLGTL